MGSCVEGLIYEDTDDTGVSQGEQNRKGRYRDQCWASPSWASKNEGMRRLENVEGESHGRRETAVTGEAAFCGTSTWGPRRRGASRTNALAPGPLICHWLKPTRSPRPRKRIDTTCRSASQGPEQDEEG